MPKIAGLDVDETFDEHGWIFIGVNDQGAYLDADDVRQLIAALQSIVGAENA